MIPILYDVGETRFTSNGLGRLADCLSCKVTEERNGIYECQFSYPVTGEMYSQIQEGRIIGVIHDDEKDIQPFDIYARSAPINGRVTFYAHHISYRLGNIILKPMTAASCAAALAAIPDNTYSGCPFTFWTDKTSSGTWKNEVPNAVRAILGGQEGSILDVYGKGEYEWDVWDVKLYASRGVDNGVSIRYGVNLVDLTQDYDVSGTYTAVVPFWQSLDDGTVVTLDEGYVKINTPRLVPWTDNNGLEITDHNGQVIQANVEDSATLLKATTLDLSDAFENQPTQAQLRAEAQRRLNSSEAWLPSENLTVKFVDLSHTEEYQAVAALQRVRLCDKVSVYCGPLGVSAVKLQVIRVVFDVLTERYSEIELGKARTTFVQAITDTIDDATKDLPSVSVMQRAINNATDQITGANGGHLRDIYDANGDRQEMVIMDTDDITTATNVWRWNSGGLGFSSTGYAGTYALAMTADGQIVADRITTGKMSANHIEGGTLTLGGNNNASGQLLVKNASGTTIGSWTKDGISISRGDIVLDTNSSFKIPLSSSNTYYIQLDRSGFNMETQNNLLSTNQSAGYAMGCYPYYPNDLSCFPLRAQYTEGNNCWTHRFSPVDVWLTREPISSANDNTSNTAHYGLDGVDAYLITGNSFTKRFRVSLDQDRMYFTGTKSRVVSTDQYADRLLYCYETPSPMFGDVGEGVIGEDGLCYVALDAVFAQTITTTQYQVFLQPYGDGRCWVRERKGAYFIVEGDPGLAFGWELKAKQRDYDQKRLERSDEPFTVPAQTYGQDAANHIQDIMKERIPA